MCHLSALPVYDLEVYPKVIPIRSLITKREDFLQAKFVIEINNNLFSPFYMENTLLYVAGTSGLHSGSIYMVSTDSGNTLKKYININNQGVFLSLNNDEDPYLECSAVIEIYGEVIASTLV